MGDVDVISLLPLDRGELPRDLLLLYPQLLLLGPELPVYEERGD